jgi:hypothetical protein
MTPRVERVVFRFGRPVSTRLDRFDRQQFGRDVIVLIVNGSYDSFSRLEEKEVVALVALVFDGEVVR